MDGDDSKAAKRLLGLELADGWTVIEIVEKTGTQTGGFFSQGYLAESKDGAQAFLKAMDFSVATEADDFARAIEYLARQFNFERDLLEFCRERRMRNVVRSIGGGMVDVAGDGNPLNRVQYFLFEPADGDIRKVMGAYEELTVAWCLKVLHETAIGLRQLHLSLVAHQDIKPSNILSFSDADKIKLGDLGCASMRGQSSPRDGLDIPGQRSYAPPEQLYSFVHADWTARRIGSDMYQLGSLCSFLFAGLSINSMLAERIDPQYLWTNWSGTYEEAMPHLKLAYAKLLDDLALRMQGTHEMAVLSIIRELCEPDLLLRGDPARIKQGKHQFTLEPFVSRLGNLRRSAEYAARRAVTR